MRGEKRTTEVTGWVSTTEIAKVNETHEFAITSDEVATVDIAVEPPWLAGKTRCAQPVMKVSLQPTVAIALVVESERVGSLA